MITLIVFILILSLLVMVHELGHFIAAKKTGVRVEEFGFGLPPRLAGKKIGETIYSINWLPFGGFVKLTGEDLEEESLVDKFDPRSFMTKSVLKRGLILSAGVFMNLLLAIVVYYAFFIVNGFRTLHIPLFFDYDFRFGRTESINTVVAVIKEGSGADESGIEVGEAILEIDGNPIYSVEDLRAQVEGKVGEEVKVLLMDLKDPSKPFRVVYTVIQEGKESTGVLGVLLSKSVVLDYNTGVDKVLSAPLHSFNMLDYSVFAFTKLIGVSVEERSVAPVSESVAGPVGIYSVVGGILDYSGDKAYLGLMDLTALMSLSLALINLLPLPALDGGRLIFVTLEAIRGKKLNPKYEAVIHKFGMMVLIGLIALVTIKDIFFVFG